MSLTPGVMGLSSVTVFEVANQMLGEPFYEVTLLSEYGGNIRTTAGFSLTANPSSAEPSIRSSSELA
jgi:transcriptional regulator GlxA family with amidase domain